jgi:hypothetical protein
MKTTELELIIRNSNCLNEFKESQYGRLYRLKNLFTHNVGYIIPEEYVEHVSLEEFVRIESNRIPFFIESRLGASPNLNELFPDDQERVIAVLHKARYASFVYSLGIYKHKKSALQRIEIAKFSNNV